MINIHSNTCILTFGANLFTVYNVFRNTCIYNQNDESDIKVLTVVAFSEISVLLVAAATGEGKLLLISVGLLLDRDLILLCEVKRQ